MLLSLVIYLLPPSLSSSPPFLVSFTHMFSCSFDDLFIKTLLSIYKQCLYPELAFANACAAEDCKQNSHILKIFQ